jgi:hypothetical protein
MLRLPAGVLAIAVLALIASAAALAQDKTTKEKPADVPLPPELRFADGSAVRLALLQDQIEVRTKYGLLTIPLTDIRNIEFGLRVPPETARRLETAASALASEEYQAREKAVAELLGLKELAWPTVRTLLKSSDKEVARRAADIHEKLLVQLTEDQRNMRSFDIIRTDDFEVRGTIQGTALKARSPYFGDIQVQYATLRQYRRLTGNDLEREVVIDAAKFGGAGKAWMDTTFEFDGDTAVLINVTGEVDLNPQGGNGQFRVGPNGTQQWGNNGGERFMPGALVGRIGDKGREFLIGEHFEGKPGERGKLFLRVAIGPWGNLSVGEYKVKIIVR